MIYRYTLLFSSFVLIFIFGVVSLILWTTSVSDFWWLFASVCLLICPIVSSCFVFFMTNKVTKQEPLLNLDLFDDSFNKKIQYDNI